MGHPAAFELRGVTCRAKDGSVLLRDVDLEIPRGGVFTIVGPSGAGKSTLLGLLNRLRDPEQGEIRFLGKPIGEIPVLELRRRVGMVFQQAALFKGTVGENVGWGPALREEKLPPEEVGSLLSEVGLEPGFAERDVATLSGGQAQRVAIARTLANRPEVLLLDEATASLDPAAARLIEELVLEIVAQRGLTAVWVSHDLDQARRVGQETLLLMDGQVVEVAPTGVFFSSPQDPRSRRFLAGDAL